MELILLGIFWVVCGVINYGYYFAYFQRRFSSLAEDNYSQDRFAAFSYAVFGPIGIVSSVITFRTFKHGLKFK
jgi:hypothetical protein